MLLDTVAGRTLGGGETPAPLNNIVELRRRAAYNKTISVGFGGGVRVDEGMDQWTNEWTK